MTRSWASWPWTSSTSVIGVQPDPPLLSSRGGLDHRHDASAAGRIRGRESIKRLPSPYRSATCSSCDVASSLSWFDPYPADCSTLRNKVRTVTGDQKGLYYQETVR